MLKQATVLTVALILSLVLLSVPSQSYAQGNTTGSTGSDASANKPTLPVLGANFGGTGPFANYVLVATLNLYPSRKQVEVGNATGAQIAVVLDDGTATAGQALATTSAFPLSGGAGPGIQGAGWIDQHFTGRVQVFAPSALTGSAIVLLRQD